ncbi:hypothetical protein SGRIM128S_09241 [Streptomyces griseomycini]
MPVDPAAFDVDKLLPDVDVSWSRTDDVHVGPEGATVPLGSLRLDVRADLPAVGNTAASADTSISGYVQVARRSTSATAARAPAPRRLRHTWACPETGPRAGR